MTNLTLRRDAAAGVDNLAAFRGGEGAVSDYGGGWSVSLCPSVGWLVAWLAGPSGEREQESTGTTCRTSRPPLRITIARVNDRRELQARRARRPDSEGEPHVELDETV